MTPPFVDTNVLIYLLSSDNVKATKAEGLLAGRVVISVQVLNEFANVCRRKLQLPWPEVAQASKDIRRFAEVHELTAAVHDQGLRLAGRYQLSLYDAMIAASALEAGCETLMSENFSAGQKLNGRLTVCNPFV